MEVSTRLMYSFHAALVPETLSWRKENTHVSGNIQGSPSLFGSTLDKTGNGVTLPMVGGCRVWRYLDLNAHAPPSVPWYFAASSGRHWRVRRRPFRNCARGQRCGADAVSKQGLGWNGCTLPPPPVGAEGPRTDRTGPSLTVLVPAATFVAPGSSSQGIFASVQGHAGEWVGWIGPVWVLGKAARCQGLRLTPRSRQRPPALG